MSKAKAFILRERRFIEVDRRVNKILESRPTLEGAGVRLKRAFGHPEVPQLDPFLLLDDFRSNNPSDYLAGFPWHPHRGIETVTYIIEGVVEHGDSMGNTGKIHSGDIQWMTAGSGIIHQEMPKQIDGTMQGFQLWVNLPSAKKMIQPRYRDVTERMIPEVKVSKGVRVKVIAGTLDGLEGPTKDLIVDSEYLDVKMDPRTEFVHSTKKGYKVFAYIFEGKGFFTPGKETGTQNVILFEDGEKVKIRSGEEGMRFLLISGKPIGEPVSWHGPIVMNRQSELIQAYQEMEEGTFLRARKNVDDE
ncbi:MAG: pirin family protein [Thaumarchaeota archaeon]|nr:pirin family protein [Nitrososphaerota archaeon]